MILIWVVVKIMVPFGVHIIILRLLFSVPKKDLNLDNHPYVYSNSHLLSPPTLQVDVEQQNGWVLNLPLVSREWKNGSNSSYTCTPFLPSLLTKAK